MAASMLVIGIFSPFFFSACKSFNAETKSRNAFFLFHISTGFCFSTYESYNTEAAAATVPVAKVVY